MLRFPFVLALCLLARGATAQVVVNFDDITATCPAGGPFSGACLVHDQYLALGVRFDSAGGGVGVNASSNPVSPPNVGTATTLLSGQAFPSYVDPVYASFWLGGGAPGTVSYVSITLSSTSSTSILEAFDLAGNSLGSSSGGASGILTVTFPGQIHSVTIHQGPMAFDDFTFDGLPGSTSAYCLGDGTLAACPCSNSGAPGHGCANSAAARGAGLTASGTARISADTLQLSSAGEPATALSIVLQGTAPLLALQFGDGLRCVSGLLKRLYVKHAVNGVVVAPQAGDPSISARSAALFDPITAGSLRYYQIYYRDPDTSFCPLPQGSTYNISNGIVASWGP
jgi:hypothetical protein